MNSGDPPVYMIPRSSHFEYATGGFLFGDCYKSSYLAKDGEQILCIELNFKDSRELLLMSGRFDSGKRMVRLLGVRSR